MSDWGTSVANSNVHVWLRSVDVEEGGGKTHPSNKHLRTSASEDDEISLTKMMTNVRLHEVTEARSVLLQHVCQRKL